MKLSNPVLQCLLLHVVQLQVYESPLLLFLAHRGKSIVMGLLGTGLLLMILYTLLLYDSKDAQSDYLDAQANFAHFRAKHVDFAQNTRFSHRNLELRILAVKGTDPPPAG